MAKTESPRARPRGVQAFLDPRLKVDAREVFGSDVHRRQRGDGPTRGWSALRHWWRR